MGTSSLNQFFRIIFVLWYILNIAQSSEASCSRKLTEAVWNSSSQNSALLFGIKKFSSAIDLEQTVLTFDYLRSGSDESGFKIPSVQRLTPQMLKYSGIRGRDLISLMFDSEIPKNLKQQIVEEYDFKLRHLIQHLAAKYKMASTNGIEEHTLVFDKSGVLKSKGALPSDYELVYETWAGSFTPRDGLPFLLTVNPKNIVVEPYTRELILTQVQ